MSDIVERLRRHNSKTEVEAADEIERLTAEVKGLNQIHVSDECHIGRLTAERDRLRAAHRISTEVYGDWREYCLPRSFAEGNEGMSDLALMEWPWKDLAEKDAEIERLKDVLDYVLIYSNDPHIIDRVHRALAELPHQRP